MWAPRRWIARWLAGRRREKRQRIVSVLFTALSDSERSNEMTAAEIAGALGTSRYELGVCLRQLERAGAVTSRLQDAPGTERVYRLAEPDDEPDTGPTPAWE